MSFLKVQWQINNVVRPLQEASVAAQKTPAGFWKLFGIWKDFFFRGDGAQVNCERFHGTPEKLGATSGSIERFAGDVSLDRCL